MKKARANQKDQVRKRVAFFLAIIMLLETMFPTASMALTSGPSAPEFSSFEPVTTTSMVNEFSGDFTYNLPVLNIPGPDGGGYALSLSYHAGESVESEASWVGYGWTLNPGSINRSKRGFADDTKSTYTYYNDVPKNWTASVGASIGDPEIFSVDIPVSMNGGLRYNNYKGFGYTAGIGLSVKGIMSLGYSVSDGTGSFSAQVNPAGLLSLAKKKKEKKEKEDSNYKKFKDKRFSEMKYDKKEKASKGSQMLSALGSVASAYGMHTLADQQMPTSVTPYDGMSFNVSLNVDLDPAVVPIGLTLGMSGNYTQQTNTPVRVHRGVGYMYSEEAYGNSSYMMDYYTEKDSPFNKRDRYLGIPFSNADQYSVTGEGLSGGFRMHRKDVGRFRPNEVSNQTLIGQLALEGNLGFIIFGAGTDIGVGVQTLSVSGDSWGGFGGSAFSDYEFTKSGDEPFFFRYNNDLGGDVDFDPDNRLVTATVSGYAPQLSPGSGYKNKQQDRMLSTIDNSVTRSGRSSYIAYHTNEEMAKVVNYKRPKAYERDNYINTTLVNRNSYGDQIGEIASINEDGNTYVYGLPVYTKNEKNISYDMKSADVHNRFLAYRNTNGNNTMKVGTECNDAYATSYLLTQITTPDYVDRTMDGPTRDDFGGYTKFEYVKNNSIGDNTAYKWRLPYQGYNYNNGDLSNPDDDMGSFSSGIKDVYFLDRIVTKTHIAVFVTADRKDGMDAADDFTAGSTTSPVHGTHKLKQLERIDLYTNDNGNLGKKIKTVHFEYGNSLCEGVPNTTGGAGENGKLTLKEVWFEYEGVVTAKTSPYKFDYTYPSPSIYPFPYGTSTTPDYFGEYASLSSNIGAQNPAYQPENVDAWGNYQKNGPTRFNEMRQHLDQTPDSDFDPAAWQLKRITLPSGGEIHVQYEQDDYQYVQNRRACALVSLIPDLLDENGQLQSCRLNVDADLGYTSLADKQALVNIINQELANSKVYFKFLYAMVGTNVPALGDCSSEYISGYVNFNGAYIETVGTTNYVKIDLGSGDSHGLPHHICDDMVKKEKLGKINSAGNCDPGMSDGGGASGIVSQLLNMFNTQLPSNRCKKVEPSLSYVRIPLLKAKKGGGLRVKRIMMYDPNGVNDGKAALYGSEYIYKLSNGESSGVALHEPATIRDENPLITFLPKRSEQSWASKAVSGVDREQFEGPLGESILPAPSVGYSRVITKNIHSGKTNTGFIISEFYTAKDFPFDMNYDPQGTTGFSGNGVDNTNITDETFEKLWVNVPAVFVNVAINNTWASQGYRFIKNNMHGQPRSVCTYGGTYSAGAVNLSNLSSSTEYEYFKPGEKVKVMQGDGSIVEKAMGKEMEIVSEARSVEDVTEDISTEFDGSLSYIPPAIFTVWFSGSGTLSYAETKMRTYVTSKVIEFPVIQKSITVTENGITNKTENLVFSAYSGEPVQTVMSDAYDGKNLQQSTAHNGKYTTYNIPGFTQYKELGQKAINERKIIYSGSDLNMNITYTGIGWDHEIALSAGTSAGICNALSALTIGDFIVAKIGSNEYYFHVDHINGNVITVVLAGNYNITGPANGSVANFEILKSGRTNQVKTNVGSYTVYGNSNSTTNSTNSLANVQTFVNQVNNVLNQATTGAFQTILTYSSDDINFVDPVRGDCMYDEKTLFDVGVSGVAPNWFHIRIYNGQDHGDERCSGSTIPMNYRLMVDYTTGEIKMYDVNAPCVIIDPDCLDLCNSTGNSNEVTNVISSSAVTMDHQWPYDANVFDLDNYNTNKNAFETGAKGKWRMKSSYVYKTNTVGGAIENGTIHERNYKNAGTYSMTKFNWKNEAMNLNTPWLATSTVTKYSPSGNAIEEKDAMDIYSSAKYGYKQKVPYMVAQNSDYGSSYFESFENVYTVGANSYLEEKVPLNPASISNTYAHSGSASFIMGSAAYGIVPLTKLTPQLNSAGASFKVWVKDPQYSAAPVSGSVTDGSVTIPIVYNKVAQTGEWTLYEGKITNWQTIAVNADITVNIKNNISGQPLIYIDDFRMQPLNAQVNAYVYDKATLKLLASFDDQHFGLFYQYNAEGKLVRKMVETEKGMKTITETQYNTPKTSNHPQ